MTGYHKVTVFEFDRDEGDEEGNVSLPVGWKPFAAVIKEDRIKVFARLWVRAE